MAVEKEDDGVGGTEAAQPDSKPIPNQPEIFSGKSCKGCLFYDYAMRNKSQQPFCLGISKTVPQVPSFIVEECEFEAPKEDRPLHSFKYLCVGYSVHLDKNNSPTDPQSKQSGLPFCVGLEVLRDNKIVAPGERSQLHVREREIEERRTFRPLQADKPSQSRGDDYFGRFTRNAGLIASAVKKNAQKVGYYIKRSIDDIGR